MSRPRKHVEDVGPFWPKNWPVVPMEEGPGVHQIRLFHQGTTSSISVRCACGAVLGDIQPGVDDCWKLFHEHEREVGHGPAEA